MRDDRTEPAVETAAVPPAATDADKAHAEGIESTPNGTAGSDHARHRRDAAGELLRKADDAVGADGRVVIAPEEDRRVLWRIDLVILPMMLTVYFLQALDKATLAYASVFGLIADTGLVGQQYSWLGSIVYVAQLVGQPPIAWVLVKLRIGKVTSTMVLFWGITLSCMASAHNFAGLITARFFLGLFEAGIAPSFIAITNMWWRRREQTLRISFWYAMNGITNMFGSLITYGLGHIDSSVLHSYQIIFIFFGVITVAFSFVMFAFMPDSPVEARFLNDRQKVVAVERQRMNQMGILSREWRWDHFREAFFDVKTWLWFSLLFSISIPSGGISTFGPLIVQSFGFDSFHTILFNIPFGFVQLVATVGGAWIAMRFRIKSAVIAGLCLPAIAGCVMLMTIPHDGAHKAALLVGYYLISVYPGITPLIYAWSSQNTGGDTKRKVVNAIMFIGQSTGNIVGPQLYTTAEAPLYSRGLRSNLSLFVVIVVLVGLGSAYITLLNRSHARKRVEMGKNAVIYDTSLMSTEEEEAHRGLAAEEPAGARAGDNAFENLTDLSNEEFVFVY